MWTEESIESIPREDDRIERKGSQLLDFSAGGNDGRARDELGKQLSAFANSGGGNIILGVDNQGRIDGGIPSVIKGRQTTKEWLEDIIPQLTEPEITGFRVLDLLRQRDDSRIATGNGVYIIEVPDSDCAPHQSARDQRYYVRLGSKSLPCSHRMIEGIRNRIRHPKIVVDKISIDQVRYAHHSDREGSLSFGVELFLRNASRVRAENVCLGLAINTPLGISCDGVAGATVRAGGKPGSILLDLNRPLYPDMQLEFKIETLSLAALDSPPVAGIRPALFTIEERPLEDVIFTLTLHADSAPINTFQFGLLDLDRDYKISQEISRSRWESFLPHENEPAQIYLGRRRR
jgi:hypothetical protein